MIALTKELQQAVQDANEQPIRLVDPETSLEYVVLPAEIFDRVQEVFYDANPLTIEEQRALLAKVGLSVGWDNPEMDVYNKLDPRQDYQKAACGRIMSVRRGEIVIVDFPYSDQTESKIRPALIVQANLWNQRLDDTILAPITSSSHEVNGVTPTQYFIDILTPEGQQTGLILNSVVRCGNLIAYNQSLILRIIGRLSPHVMQQVDECLKAALGIP